MTDAGDPIVPCIVRPQVGQSRPGGREVGQMGDEGLEPPTPTV